MNDIIRDGGTKYACQFVIVRVLLCKITVGKVLVNA